MALLREGDETGLAFFYQRYFGHLLFRARRVTKDECTAESIAQEAFYRLWLFRSRIEDLDGLRRFLAEQVRAAITDYFTKTRNRFHRSLLRLDGIEDYQEFMLGHTEEGDEEDEDLVYFEQLECEKQEKINKLNALLPHLREEQQLFIRLCLKYSFSYDRIAHYLGGISDYEVGLRVENAISTLRKVFDSSEKLNLMNKPTTFRLEGEFDDVQSDIFHMRYELQYSFDEISEALHLNGSQVRQLFVEAHARLKATRKERKLA